MGVGATVAPVVTIPGAGVVVVVKVVLGLGLVGRRGRQRRRCFD